MIFSKVFKSNPVQAFEVQVTSGGNNNVVAFGPASIINGSIKLFLDKPIKAKSIRVVFKCEEWDQKKEPCTLFSVESSIWTHREGHNEELETGSHIYLFAIQLPSSVNYPPTIRDAYLGHRIEYSLQGFLDYDTSQEKSTVKLPLTYLPLVTFDDQMNQQRKHKTIKIAQKNDEYIQVTANLVNPSSCPGDLCSIKLTTQNHSSHSINQVHVILLSTATSLNDNATKYPDLPTSSGPSYHHKQRQILSESFYVSIPKHTANITTICPFRVPSFCVPTTQSHFGRYIDITYEIFIIIPTNHHYVDTSSHQLLLNPHAIRLPLFITTVPYSSNLPPKLQIPFADENNMDVPSFIANQESPLGSPTNLSPSGGSYCNWGPGSPLDPNDEEEDGNEDRYLPPRADASGHLMVPPLYSSSSNSRRSISIHSTGSK